MSFDVISSISLLLALAAFGVSLWSVSETRRASQLTEHYEIIVASDNMLGSDLSLLRFHGIDSTRIEELYGLDGAALAYLLQSFNAGSIEYLLKRRSRDSAEVFPRGSYRYEFLSNPETQRAFPLIEQLFDSKNAYIAKCRRTIESFPTDSSGTSTP